MELRPYQHDFVEAVLKAQSKRLLGVLPTGTGKTICFASIAKQLNRPTLIIAHRDELIAQACEKIKMVWQDADIGVVKAERHEIDRQVIVASVSSLYKERLATLSPVGLLITDEAHHAPAPSYRRIYHRFGFLDESPDDDPLDIIGLSDAIHLGVTATPQRSDKLGLAPIFDEIVYERKFMDFVPEYLSDLRIRGVKAKLDFSEVRVSRLTRDFDENQLADMMQEVTADIFRAYQDFAHDRTRTLVFCVNRAHALGLWEYFNEQGIASGYLDFKTPQDERKAILDDFRSGAIKCLFNVMILTEGFDLPEIDCILIARPTKSPLLLTQMIGRGTRNAEGKTDCMVIDVAQFQRGNNAVTVASLFDLSTAQLTDDPVSQMIAQMEETEGKGEKEPMPEPDAYSVSVILDSILSIPDKWLPKKAWHYDPATIKQVAFLQSQFSAVGERLPEGLSKGQASEMISAIFDSQPATIKQRKYLAALGVEFEENLSKQKAGELIDRALWQQPKDSA